MYVIIRMKHMNSFFSHYYQKKKLLEGEKSEKIKDDRQQHQEELSCRDRATMIEMAPKICFYRPPNAPRPPNPHLGLPTVSTCAKVVGDSIWRANRARESDLQIGYANRALVFFLLFCLSLLNRYLEGVQKKVQKSFYAPWL